MGGSAIGGALARATLGDHASRPILAARAYGLPPWTTPDTTVLCATYSGNTEETLACYEAAGVIGARRVVVTTGGELAEQARADGVPVIPVAGGLQPRAAVGLHDRGRARGRRAVRRRAAAAGPRSTWPPSTSRSSSRPGGRTRPTTPSPRPWPARCTASVPVISGAGLTTPLAYRWKTQINENAKLPAFSVELPELDHNEIVRLGRRRRPRRASRAVFLDDADTHPRVQARIELTRADRRRGRHRRRPPCRVARLDRRRARPVARPARRPRLALPGGAARRRPDAGAGDRAPQAGPGVARSAMTKLLLLPITAPASAWRAGRSRAP